jgi:PAS domain S-box-containing protein
MLKGTIDKKKKRTSSAFLNLIGDPVTVVDLKGKFLFINTAYEKEIGRREEWIGKSLLSSPNFPTASKKLLMENLKKRSTGISILPYEVDLVRVNGEIKQFEINAKSIDYAGQPAVLVISRDVTQRKKYETQLKEYSEKLEWLVDKKAVEIKESEEKLRGIFDSSPDGIIFTDPQATIVECNPAAVNMFGFSSKMDAIGKNAFELAGMENLDKILDFLGKLLRQGAGTARNIGYSFINKKGFEVAGEFSLSATKDDLGRVTGYVAVTKDMTERKKDEEKLQTSERRYRKLYEHLKHAKADLLQEKNTAQNYLEVADVLLVALDINGNVMLLNRKGCAILGCKIEYALGKNWFGTFVPKEERAEGKRLHQLLVERKSKRPAQQETVVLCSNGEKRIIAWRHKVVKNSKGKVTGTLSSGEDITDQKRTQQALLDSEEKFRSIVENSNDVILLATPNGSISYISSSCTSMMGYSPEEFNGKVPSVYHPDDFGKVKDIVARSTRGEKGSDFEYRVITKKGEIRWVSHSWSPILENGKVKMVASIIRDITESKKMEAAFKQERDMLESMAANIGAGLTIINRDYRILWANQLLKEINGHNLENKFCYSIYDKSGKICPDCGVKKVFESGATVDRHDYHYQYESTDAWIELIVTPIKDKDGEVIAALELAVNITERKQLQDKLADYSQKLEEMVEQRTEQLKQTQAKLVKSERLAPIGELAGMVGHDLRNPLTSIKGAAYFLKAKYSSVLDATGREMLSTMDDSINYSNKIINDLLDYSREMKLELSEATPKNMLKNALLLVEVPEKIEICDATLDTPIVNIDTGKMTRVFVNIIKNSFDAMPKGGKLTVTSKEAKGNWEIIFEDNGHGMNQETLSKLWTPLFTTKAKGMGFGLAICKRVLEGHGGKITVESTIGKGTRFILEAPINPKTLVEEIWIRNPQLTVTNQTERLPSYADKET